VNYIVRFDADKFEFVAEVSHLSEFSKIKQSGSHNILFLGAFSEIGTYFLGGRSDKKNTDVIAIRNIHLLQGYSSQDAEELPVLSPSTHDVSYSKLPGKGGDFVVANGDFDNSGINAEWLFMMQNDFSLSLGKVVGSDVRGMLTWKLKQDKFEAGPLKAQTFGAGWSYQGEVYFARNNGEGVFHVHKESLDLTNKKFQVAKRAESKPTNKNDGMCCMEHTPVFYGSCPPPEYETIPVDGQCPPGSRVLLSGALNLL
jgi:hypothetical protein